MTVASKRRRSRPGRGPGAKGRGAKGGKGGKRASPSRRGEKGGRRARGVKVTPAAAPELDDGRVRLNRFLAEAGLCSRRAADDWIRGGRVEINGEPVTELGVRVDPATDDVAVDGRPVRVERKVYLLFNKPKGVVCTSAKNEQRVRVVDCLPGVRGRIYTVGRLDADSEGLILLTNDGDFSQLMSHPRFGVPKTYAVLVRGRVTPQVIDKARGGIWLAEGRTGGARIRVARKSRDRTYLKVELREGRNREIRRVFARLGFPVISLKRVRIGNQTLHGLSRGGYRFLNEREVRDLVELARSEPSPEEG